VSQHPETSNVIFTDICQKSNHRSHDEIPRSVRDAYYRKRFDQKIHTLDIDFYNRTKAVYDKHGAWTWDFPPADKASLFIINETK